MEESVTQQSTTVSAAPQPTSTDLWHLFGAVQAIVREEIRKQGSGVDVTKVLPGYLTEAIAQVSAANPQMDSLMRGNLEQFATYSLNAQYGVGTTTEFKAPTHTDTITEIGAHAFVNFSKAFPEHGDIAVAGASAIANENHAAVITTSLLAHAGITDPSVRQALEPEFIQASSKMWDAVNTSSDSTAGQSAVRSVVAAAVGGALSRAVPGSREAEALQSMQAQLKDNQLNNFITGVAKAPWSAGGLTELAQGGFDRLAGALQPKDPNTAASLHAAGTFVGTRQAPGGGGLPRLFDNMRTLGVGGTVINAISATLGDTAAGDRLTNGVVNPTQERNTQIAAQQFQKQLINLYPGMQLWAPDSKWANAFTKQYYGAGTIRGENGVFASKRGIDWAPMGGFVAFHNDSALKKGLMVASMFAPPLFVADFLSGSFGQKMAWVGTGFGKDIHNPAKYGRFAKTGIGMMQSGWYKNTVRVAQSAKGIIMNPFNRFSDGVLVAWTFLKDRLTPRPGEKTSATQEAAKGLAWGILISAVTGGAMAIPELIKIGANWVTNGEVDRILKKINLFAIGAVIVVVAIIAVLLSNFLPQMAGGNIALFEQYGYSSAGVLPWNKDYRPVLVQRTGDPTTEPGPGANCVNGQVVPLPSSSRIEPKFSPTQGSTEEYPNEIGIDVSHWDGNIDWGKVKGDSQKLKFAIMKASEGTSYYKPYRDQFKQWWKASKDAGMKRTAYHFFRPDEDGYSQANYFLNTIYEAGTGEFGDFQVAVDIEMTDYLNLDCGLQLSTDNLKAFLDQVEAMLGYKAIIYTSNTMWQALTTQPSWSGDYPLWVAAWNSGTSPGTLPKGWSDYLIWQYSDSGTVDGITQPAGNSSSVDMNRWHK